METMTDRLTEAELADAAEEVANRWGPGSVVSGLSGQLLRALERAVTNAKFPNK